MPIKGTVLYLFNFCHGCFSAFIYNLTSIRGNSLMQDHVIDLEPLNPSVVPGVTIKAWVLYSWVILLGKSSSKRNDRSQCSECSKQKWKERKGTQLLDVQRAYMPQEMFISVLDFSNAWFCQREYCVCQSKMLKILTLSSEFSVLNSWL